MAIKHTHRHTHKHTHTLSKTWARICCHFDH